MFIRIAFHDVLTTLIPTCVKNILILRCVLAHIRSQRITLFLSFHKSAVRTVVPEPPLLVTAIVLSNGTIGDPPPLRTR